MKPSGNNPLISVIVPVYNVAKFLEPCLTSITSQTYQNLEIIVINDGSTDLSGQFCDVYAERDPRVRVLHQKNSGLSAARNSGLSIAKGDYITFIDSDDLVSPCLIETLLHLCLQHHTLMSICSFTEFSDERTLPGYEGLPPGTPSIELLQTFPAIERMLLEQGFSMSAWGKLYHRSLWQTTRFPVGKLYEDVGTTYRCILKSPKIAVTSAPLYYYRQNPTAITKQSFSPRKLDLITLTDQMCDDLITWSNSQPSSIQLKIRDLTLERRMHARFSILRQLPSKLTPETKAIRRNLTTYLRTHRADILQNPVATQRDQLALRALLLGYPAFRLAWRLYSKLKSN